MASAGALGRGLAAWSGPCLRSPHRPPRPGAAGAAEDQRQLLRGASPALGAVWHPERSTCPSLCASVLLGSCWLYGSRRGAGAPRLRERRRPALRCATAEAAPAEAPAVAEEAVPAAAPASEGEVLTPAPPAAAAAAAAAGAAAPPQGEGEEAEAKPAAAAPQSPPRRQRVLSGVQPTGDLHLGNYFGAIKQWVGMQEEYDCFFCVVDLHAITVEHNPKELRKAVLTTAAAYLASGIDPEKSAVFVQSAVPAHSQLAWLLNTQTPMRLLNAMTQYKEKSTRAKAGTAVCLGLFAYPVLMAADILLYQADKVPVGEDQMEHLYLARDIAERMNKKFAKTAYKKRRLFRMPDPLVGKSGARVMGLTDGSKKMSKSDPDPMSRINIIDEPSVIKRKIKRCKTDTVVGVELGNPERPEATNLLRLYALTSGRTEEEAAEECKSDNWGTFKGKLTESMIEYLTPIQSEYKRLLNDKTFLKETLEKGAQKADEEAARTLKSVEFAMGFGF